MRTPILSAVALSLMAVPVAAPAAAQSSRAERDYRKAEREARREYRQDVRQARREYREYQRYDYNRPEPGYDRYYADRYYRDDPSYRPRVLSANERIYRGQDGRYYCRRSDGTTGLIVGGVAGGLLGRFIAPGGSNTLGTLLGGAAGALAGRAIQRDNVRCR